MLKELNLSLHTKFLILVWFGTAKGQQWKMQKSHRGPELSQFSELRAKCSLFRSLGSTNILGKWYVLITELSQNFVHNKIDNILSIAKKGYVLINGMFALPEHCSFSNTGLRLAPPFSFPPAHWFFFLFLVLAFSSSAKTGHHLKECRSI